VWHWIVGFTDAPKGEERVNSSIRTSPAAGQNISPRAESEKCPLPDFGRRDEAQTHDGRKLRLMTSDKVIAPDTHFCGSSDEPLPFVNIEFHQTLVSHFQ
jgi:hypothetical protein